VGKNMAKVAVSVATDVKPEVEIWWRPQKINVLTLVSYLIQNVTDDTMCQRCNRQYGWPKMISEPVGLESKAIPAHLWAF